MSHPLLRVQNGKYERARKLQEEYRRKGIVKPMIDCYVEIDLEDRATTLMRPVEKAMRRGFKL